jgi:hypothetical protein
MEARRNKNSKTCGTRHDEIEGAPVNIQHQWNEHLKKIEIIAALLSSSQSAHLSIVYLIIYSPLISTGLLHLQ